MRALVAATGAATGALHLDRKARPVVHRDVIDPDSLELRQELAKFRIYICLDSVRLDPLQLIDFRVDRQPQRWPGAGHALKEYDQMIVFAAIRVKEFVKLFTCLVGHCQHTVYTLANYDFVPPI